MKNISNNKNENLYNDDRRCESIIEEDYEEKIAYLNSVIEEKEKCIDEKNAYIYNLQYEKQNIENSKSYKLSRFASKMLRPLKILFSFFVRAMRKIKRILKRIFIKLGFVDEDNSYKNIKAIDSWYQENEDYSNFHTDIKTLAFYLPQFHTFKENDEWWGKGFTEWVNAKKAKPRYKDHYQPRLPHDDIGYYDLTNIESIKKQVELAKKHGIYGFCFYYYWFSGKRLMEKPVDLLLEHPEIDINFCLCWANENFTKKWDGQNNNILIAQEYSKKDPVIFIRDIKKYMDDSRYIKVNGKPVILIYNPDILPNIENVIKKWREEARKIGIGEIEVWTRNLLVEGKKPINNSDAEFDFPPLQKGFSNSVLSGLKDGHIYNYSVVVEEMIKLYDTYQHPKKLYLTSTMAWDNSSRRKDGYVVFHGYSLKKFYEWNKAIIEKTRMTHDKDDRFMFVNAWNEWCEGTYLDPDQKYGYANINTLSKALFDIPFEGQIITNNENSIAKNKSFNKKIAIQIHIFYPELSNEVIEHLNKIPYSFDCYITTSDEEKKKIIEKSFSKCKAKKVIIDVSNNRGRDVAPFLVQMKKYANEYDYICHIHTKKSKTVAYGDTWRKYLYNNLFGSEKNIINIFDEFEKNEKLGVVFPEIYPIIINQVGYYGNNLERCKKEFKRLGIPDNYINSELVFPAGTMFWAKVDAIKPLFDADYKYSNFAKEKNQLDATTAHAIERIFCSLASSRGYYYKKIINNSNDCELIKKNRVIIYCYDGKTKIEENDIYYLKELYKISHNLVIITRVDIDDKIIKQLDKIQIVKTQHIFYNNMWIDYLINNKINNNVEEIIVTNNGQFYSGKSLIPMINSISNNQFFSSYYLDGDTDKLNLNLFIMKSSLLQKKDFLNVLKSSNDKEKTITNYLKTKKITYNVFISETSYINNYLVNKPIELYEPYSLIILGSPTINKNTFKKIDYIQKDKINYLTKISKNDR